MGGGGGGARGGGRGEFRSEGGGNLADRLLIFETVEPLTVAGFYDPPVWGYLAFHHNRT